MIALSILSLLLATTALGAPSRRDNTFHGACSVPASGVTIPSTFDPLTSAPNLVLLGVGVQNYTCNSSAIFNNVGVVARMFDISYLYGKPEFTTIQDDAFDDWSACSSFNPLEQGLVQEMKDHYGITEDGAYYFVQQNGALVPVWDLTSNSPYAGNANAIIYAQKYKAVPSPDGPENIDWVELKKLSGGLANVIYRVDTVLGQPPSTCTPGSNAIVKYTAKYYFV